MHNAAERTSAANAARVYAGTSFPYLLSLSPIVCTVLTHISVVFFGDPKRGQPFGSIPMSKTITFCHIGDNICDGGSIITPTHLDYQRDAPAAAEFVAGKLA